MTFGCSSDSLKSSTSLSAMLKHAANTRLTATSRLSNVPLKQFLKCSFCFISIVIYNVYHFFCKLQTSLYYLLVNKSSFTAFAENDIWIEVNGPHFDCAVIKLDWHGCNLMPYISLTWRVPGTSGSIRNIRAIGSYATRYHPTVTKSVDSIILTLFEFNENEFIYSLSIILQFLAESKHQNSNYVTYVSVYCYQSKSYNDHQNNDSFQFFVFPCLNIIWKMELRLSIKLLWTPFNLIFSILIFDARLPFIIGNNSVRNLKKSRDRRKVPSIVLIAENPFSIKLRL